MIHGIIASVRTSVADPLVFSAPLTEDLLDDEGSATTTFVRATIATVEVSDGTIDDVASGEARFQGSTHNGEDDWTAHANSDGIRIEEARTNLCKNSETTTGWTEGQTTASDAQGTSPRGTNTAVKVVEAASPAVHYYSSASISFTDTVPYTMYKYLKVLNTDTIFQLTFPSASFGSSQYCNFDLSDGSVGTVVGGTGRIKDAGDGWYRCAFTATATATAAGIPGLVFTDNNDGTGRTPSFIGDVTEGAFVGGAGVNVGAFPLSHIVTTTTAVTRDLEEVDGDASLYKDTMTITGEFNSGVDSGTGAMVFEFSDGTANNACYFWKDASGDLEMNITVGGVEKYSEVAAWTPGTTKFAIALSTTIGESAVYIDGARLDASPTTDAGHVGLEGTVDEFRIGRWIDDSLALNGTLKNFKIYHELKDATWLAADSTP